jgi:hypothetical protein
VIVQADARHVRIVTAGVLDHKNLERETTFFGEAGNLLRYRSGGIVIEIDNGFFRIPIKARKSVLL